MKQKDKKLLLKDLCSRLPYGVIVQLKYDNDTLVKRELGIGSLHDIMVGNAQGTPYLRTMSSMAEEEVKEFYDVECMDAKVGYIKPTWNWHFTINGIDWLIANHFDYRGLIPKGLAIAVTKENNPYENINLQTWGIYQ